jgi:hypothetical protein
LEREPEAAREDVELVDQHAHGRPLLIDDEGQ